MSNLWAGIFADWDIQDYNLNKGNENPALKMGYVYNTTPTGLWAGIKVLTATPFNHYAVDNIAGQGGVNLTDGYDTNEKYTTLSNQRPLAGINGQGNDVIDVVSTGPFTIAAGDSVVVAFALIAGDDLDDLNTSAGNAQIKYDGLFTSAGSTISTNNGVSIFPNPANSWLYVSTNDQLVNLVEIMDVTGRVVRLHKPASESEKLIKLNTETLPAGNYLVRVTSEKGVSISKIVKN